MNVVTIFSGIAVLGLAALSGFIAVQLFIIGGVTAIFGGIAMGVVSVMTLAIGTVLICMGGAGIASRFRTGKALW